MGGVNESVKIGYRPAAEAEAAVLSLDRPWIADEGPLDAELWRHQGGDLRRPLRLRGLAFDARTTVVWDEDQVQVIEPEAAQADVIPRRSPVLVRPRLGEWTDVERVDYLHCGVLLASRYVPIPEKEAADA